METFSRIAIGQTIVTQILPVVKNPEVPTLPAFWDSEDDKLFDLTHFDPTKFDPSSPLVSSVFSDFVSSNRIFVNENESITSENAAVDYSQISKFFENQKADFLTEILNKQRELCKKVKIFTLETS